VKRFIPLIGPCFLVLLWQLVAFADLVSPILLPSPVNIIAAGGRLLAAPSGIWVDVLLTFTRTLAAFALALIVGAPIGLLMGVSTRIYQAFSATFDFFRSIPPIALFPIFILFFGISEAARIAVPFYGTVLVIIVNSAYGVANSPKLRSTVARVFQLSPAQRFVHVTLPSALAHIVAGARIAISLSLVLVIVVEMTFGANRGLGRLVYEFHTVFETESMYFVIMVIGVIGYLLNLAFEKIEATFVPWKGQ
jgi:ABC-type nitrate/sulfonate/bicarbonate transport system permease component